MSRSLFGRRPALALLGLAAAAALFSGGFAARAAFDSDDDGPAASAPASSGGAAQNSPGKTLIAPAAVPAGFGQATIGNAGAAAGRGGLDSIASPTGPGFGGGCPVPMDAAVVANGTIDPAKAGFAMKLLQSGFRLQNISLSNVGECDTDGQASGEGELVLATSWRHEASGAEVYVSQQVAKAPISNVLGQAGASFWADGYAYYVNVNAYRILTAEDAASSRVKPAIYPPYPGSEVDQAKVLALLTEAVGQLAPSVGMQCFYREAQGGWGDLASLGIGDPRGAIPAGFTEQQINVRTFTPPAAGCDTPKPDAQGGFDAAFARDGGDFAQIGISAYAHGGMTGGYPGQLSDYGANWSNDRFQFSVYGKFESGTAGVEVIRAIAKALDPSFNEACLVRQRELGPADLAALSFATPVTPDGFKVTNSSVMAQDIAAGCDKPEGFEASYNLQWTMEDGGGTVIEAYVSRYGGAPGGKIEGYISDNNIYWVGADGTNYSVNGYSRSVSATVDRDALVAVAKSLDPSLDIDALAEQPGGGVKPLPEGRPAR